MEDLKQTTTIFKDQYSKETFESLISIEKPEILYLAKRSHGMTDYFVKQKLKAWITGLVFKQHVKTILVTFRNYNDAFAKKCFNFLFSDVVIMEANGDSITFEIDDEKYQILFIPWSQGHKPFIGVTANYIFCILDEFDMKIKDKRLADALFKAFIPMTMILKDTRLVFYCLRTSAGKTAAADELDHEEIITGFEAIKRLI